MRELNREELSFIAGSKNDKKPSDENSENNIGGVTGTNTGSDLMPVYLALVAATTDLMERVALALK